MNKKVSIAVTLIAVFIMATPLVSAKPSAEKNNDKFLSFVWHSQNSYNVDVEGSPRYNPPWATDEDYKVGFYERDFFLTPGQDNYIEIDGTKTPILPENYECHYYTVEVVFARNEIGEAVIGGLNYRVYEKITWGTNNYIEIMSLERAVYDMTVFPPVFEPSGTFNGHGEIGGQRVQVMGVREAGFGPAGFVIENTGTIQFLGNVP